LEYKFNITEIEKLTLIICNGVEKELVKSIIIKPKYQTNLMHQIRDIKRIEECAFLSRKLGRKELWPCTKYNTYTNNQLKELLND
jgi:hypothetical protein